MILPAIYLLGCLLCGVLGRYRTIGFWGFLVTSLIITPVVCLLVLLITKEMPEAKSMRSKASLREMWQRTRNPQS